MSSSQIRCCRESGPGYRQCDNTLAVPSPARPLSHSPSKLCQRINVTPRAGRTGRCGAFIARLATSPQPAHAKPQMRRLSPVERLVTELNVRYPRPNCNSKNLLETLL